MADTELTPAEITTDEFDFNLDLSSFFNSIPGDFNLEFDLPLPNETPATEEKSPASSMSSWANELEKFLLEEEAEREIGDDVKDFPEEFFADVFADASDDGSVKSVVSSGDAKTPESDVVEGCEEEKNEGSEGKSGEEEDEISRKKRRQLRNRDSAMKSRERKKVYVQDLEMKSKFLEAECRRLEHVLRCFAAENIALKHRLQKDKVPGVSQAKQESAVLFMESLLLGSLFWLVSIVFLFLAHDLSAWNLSVEAVEKAKGLGESWNQVTMGTRRSGNKRLSIGLGSGSIFLGRRCKALKPKMRILLSPCA